MSKDIPEIDDLARGINDSELILTFLFRLLSLYKSILSRRLLFY